MTKYYLAALIWLTAISASMVVPIGNAKSTVKLPQGQTGEELAAQARQWEEDSPLKKEVYDYIIAETDRLQAKLPALTSPKLWRTRKAEIRKKLLGSLFGSDKLPARAPLNARVVGRVEYSDYILEKIVFESWPGVPVSAHLYLPKQITKPVPCVLYTLGHYYRGKTQRFYTQGETDGPRPFCIGMVRHGLAVFIYDGVSQGERNASQPWIEIDHTNLFTTLQGVSQIGLMVWESIRAIDYLTTRPDLDSKRIGITGASGGGINTMYTAAIEDRLAVAAPVCYPTTSSVFMRAVNGRAWNGGLDLCSQVYDVISYADDSDLLACFAPKPQLLMTATQDIVFQIAGAREAAKRMTSLYQMMAPGNFYYVEDDAPHSYTKNMREAAYGFFLKELAGRGNGSPVAEAPLPMMEPWDDPALKCFPEGFRPIGPYLEKLIPSWLPKSPEFAWVPKPQELPRWQSGLRSRIEEVCKVRPTQQSATVATSDTVCTAAGEISLRRVLLTPETGITVPMLLASKQGLAPKQAVVIASKRSKTEIIGSPLAQQLIELGLLVAAADVRGIGESSADEFEIATSLWMLKQTLTGGWITDLRSVVRYLKNDLGAEQVCLAGIDGLAQTAVLAAAITPEIDSVATEGLLSSYRDLLSREVRWDTSTYLPGVLKYFDLPQTVAAIAPRRCLVLNPLNGKRELLNGQQIKTRYEFAARIYQRLSAADALRIEAGTLEATAVASLFQ